jgi:glycosyltransferase involved in cell wall biosynthesis
VLMGTSILPIPDNPRIGHLGFVSDEDKFDGLAAAEALIMPSYFESLSMVALEAWALGKPVLANGRCDVLQGQCLRSNAGLFYESYAEFLETLALIQSNRRLALAMGQNGREYFQRHYAWPVIVRKYLDMLERLQQEDAGRAARPAIEPLPGWFARRRADCRAGNDVVQGLPAGPARRSGRPR